MKSFVCSLCHNGIVGGGLYLDSQSLTYKTNKLTVGKKYRNLVLPMQEIKEISWKWIVFPIATVATVYKGNIIKNLIMDCQSYTKYRPNETTGGIFVSWRRKEELPTGA